MERGQPGLTLENIEKPLIHFASPRPRKPLNCLKKLSPSPKTIEVFGKPPPVPFPCDRGGDREGDPFIQCPLPSSLMLMHYRSEPKTEYECRFSYYQIRIIWIESSCISEFRRRWSENFVPWHSRSHRARIQVPFINYIRTILFSYVSHQSIK